MKTVLKTLAFSAIVLMLVAGFVSCDRDNYVPEETRADIFECYLNGERFVQMPGTRLLGNGSVVSNGVWARFSTEGSYQWLGTDIMQIIGVSTQGELISISIQNFFGKARYDTVFLQLNNQLYKISDCKSSWVIITEFDTVNQTVSGAFQIVTKECLIYVYGPWTIDSVFADIRITEGYFDTRYFIAPHPSSNFLYDFYSQIPKLLNPYTLKIKKQ